MTNDRYPPARLHKRSGRARFRWKGREFWLGKYGTRAAEQKRARLVELLQANDGHWPPGRIVELTVQEILDNHIERSRLAGLSDGEVKCQRSAFATPIHLYGDMVASEFTKVELRKVRSCIEGGRGHLQTKLPARSTINQYIGRVQRAFLEGTRGGRRPSRVSLPYPRRRRTRT